jgi:hypothetical protein
MTYCMYRYAGMLYAAFDRGKKLFLFFLTVLYTTSTVLYIYFDRGCCSSQTCTKRVLYVSQHKKYFYFQHEIFAAHTAHSLNHHTKTTFIIMIDHRLLIIVSTTQQRSADRRIIKGLSIIIIYNKKKGY